MTEVVVESADQPNGSDALTTQPSSGQLLRQAREQQHMTVQTLAAMLKVPVYKLQALEEDRWDTLADTVFTRSLALSVCRILRIPTEPVLAGLPKHEAVRLASNPEGINAPFKEKTLRSLMAPADTGSGNSLKIAAALLIAVAGAAGLYVLPKWQTDDAAAATGVLETEPQPVLVLSAEEVEPARPLEVAAGAVVTALPFSAVPEAPAAQSLAQAEPVPAQPEQAAAEVALTAATEAPATPQVLEEVAPAVAAASGQGPVLRFAATGESWVQVRDAQDRIVMERILKAGDVYEEAAPSRPLKVVIGNAGVTTLKVDGAALDLVASARNNVARVEVK